MLAIIQGSFYRRGHGMRLRRLGVLIALAAALVVGVGAPALAATSTPTYPPGGGGGGGGGGTGPIIQIDRTLAVVGGYAYVFIWNCTPLVTLTVTGPGRSPGVPVRSGTVTASPDTNGKITQQVTFDRVGRNTVSVTCGNGSASIRVTVKAATVAPTKPAGVLGESLPSSVGAAVGALVKTGANVGPLLLALPLLLLGLGLVALSRPRRRRRRQQAG